MVNGATGLIGSHLGPLVPRETLIWQDPIPALDPTNEEHDIAALKTNQVTALTTAQVGGLTTGQVAALSYAQVGSLTTAQASAAEPSRGSMFRAASNNGWTSR